MDLESVSNVVCLFEETHNPVEQHCQEFLLSYHPSTCIFVLSIWNKDIRYCINYIFPNELIILENGYSENCSLYSLLVVLLFHVLIFFPPANPSWNLVLWFQRFDFHSLFFLSGIFLYIFIFPNLLYVHSLISFHRAEMNTWIESVWQQMQMKIAVDTCAKFFNPSLSKNTDQRFQNMRWKILGIGLRYRRMKLRMKRLPKNESLNWFEHFCG